MEAANAPRTTSPPRRAVVAMGGRLTIIEEPASFGWVALALPVLPREDGKPAAILTGIASATRPGFAADSGSIAQYSPSADEIS